jgi:hypothetical protein
MNACVRSKSASQRSSASEISAPLHVVTPARDYIHFRKMTQSADQESYEGDFPPEYVSGRRSQLLGS